jgi:hypothetical protein
MPQREVKLTVKLEAAKRLSRLPADRADEVKQ